LRYDCLLVSYKFLGFETAEAWTLFVEIEMDITLISFIKCKECAHWVCISYHTQ